MLGRRQAILVILLFGFFPLLYFVSAAIVALINLRKGLQEGLIALLWSMLPAGILFAFGKDATPVILFIGVTVFAQMLRKTESWSTVIMCCIGLGLISQLSLIWQSDYTSQVNQMITEAVVAQQNQGDQPVYNAEQLVSMLLGLYGAYHMAFTLLCLMLARWWQAAMYNPGGFRLEFHELKFKPQLMLVLLGLILAGMMNIEPLATWLPIFCLPPIFGGMAVIHSVVAKKQLGSAALIIGYVTLFIMAPIIVLLGLLDSVVDLRKKMNKAR